jgi:hypothetical protein
MFRCQLCQSVVPKGTRSQKLIITTRPKQYAAKEPDRTQFRRSPRGFRERIITPRDRGGEGSEIVQEISVCPRCAEQHSARQAPPAEAQQAEPVQS